MAVIRPFRAVRPDPAAAPRVAAVPYDVVDTAEARALAGGNPLSFLHVSRAEIDLPPGTDPHADIVYRTAAKRYRELKRDAPFMQEAAPALYLYHLDSDGHGQTGIAACYSLAEYDGNAIKKNGTNALMINNSAVDPEGSRDTSPSGTNVISVSVERARRAKRARKKRNATTTASKKPSPVMTSAGTWIVTADMTNGKCTGNGGCVSRSPKYKIG